MYNSIKTTLDTVLSIIVSPINYIACVENLYLAVYGNLDFKLRAINLHWINGASDDPSDLCLHGNVFAKIGDEIVDDGVVNGDWTVSAGAYRMLESLYNDHISGNEEHLLPCCGHFMSIDEKIDKLIIIGCPNGLDWAVIHENNMVKLKTSPNTQVILSFDQYKEVIFEFSDAIKSFYEKSSPKAPKENFEKDAYNRFWMDWEKMRTGGFR